MATVISKMSLISAYFFWLDYYKRLELCFRTGALFVTAKTRSYVFLFFY